MRKIPLLRLLCLIVFASGAGAQGVQNSDIFWLFGWSGVKAQSLGTSGVTLGSSSGLTFNYGYGYQILRKSAASLWIEFSPFFSGSSSVSGSIPGSANLSWSAFAPGVRFMVPVQSRISVYGIAGGGVGEFHVPVILAGTKPVLSDTNTWHGLFDIGGGVDFRLTRFLSMRGEFHDYVTGQGLSGAAGRNHPMAFGGFALHF